MKVKQVRRFQKDWEGKPAKTKIHRNCYLQLNDNSGVMLSGPKMGGIADGFVKGIHTAYEGADYQISFDVMVQVSWKRQEYRLEQWYVTF